MQMRAEYGKPYDGGNPRGQRAEISATLWMTNGSENETADKKHRVVLTQHRERGCCASGNGPYDLTSLKGAQEAIGSDWPSRQKNRVSIEPLSVKLVGRQQHQKQQHDYSLISPYEAARNQIDSPQSDCRIVQRHQLKRPIGERKYRGPRSRDPSHERGMF